MRRSQSSRCSSVKCIGSMPSLTPNARSPCRITAKMEPNSYVAKHEVNPQSRACCRDDNRAGGVLRASTSKRAFRVVLIKPSHYDQDGYVIQWWRSTLPSNSLASVYGLVEECARAGTLGADVEIEIEACDECNTVVDVDGVARRIRASGGGMVGLIGVQSNQFPRALDLGRQFRAHGLPVVMGGFHISGCISMLPELPSDLKEALDLGLTLFAGEAEGRMAEVLRDVSKGKAQPIYNYLSDR